MRDKELIIYKPIDRRPSGAVSIGEKLDFYKISKMSLLRMRDSGYACITIKLVYQMRNSRFPK